MNAVYVLLVFFTNTTMNMGIYREPATCEAARAQIQQQLGTVGAQAPVCLKLLKERGLWE